MTQPRTAEQAEQLVFGREHETSTLVAHLAHKCVRQKQEVHRLWQLVNSSHDVESVLVAGWQDANLEVERLEETVTDLRLTVLRGDGEKEDLARIIDARDREVGRLQQIAIQLERENAELRKQASMPDLEREGLRGLLVQWCHLSGTLFEQTSTYLERTFRIVFKHQSPIWFSIPNNTNLAPAMPPAQD